MTEKAPDSPVFSVIVPLLNPGPELNQCLAALISQKFANWEAILVDGGSLDVESILDLAASDSRVLVVSLPSSSIYQAINHGILNSRGEWIIILGSDDTLFSDYTLLQVSQFLDQSIHSSVSAVYGSVVVIDAPWVAHGSTYAGRFSLSKLVKQNICHQAIFYRAIIARSGSHQYDSRYPVLADWHYNLKTWILGRFQYVPITVAVYNGNGASFRSYLQDPFAGRKGIWWLYLFCRSNGLSVPHACLWCLRLLLSGLAERTRKLLVYFM